MSAARLVIRRRIGLLKAAATAAPFRTVARPARRWPSLVLVGLVAAGPLFAACADSGPSGSTNVQGGAIRAPEPGGQTTPRPTSTPPR
jgi:hypothetical protein